MSKQFESLGDDLRIVVVGASGGIGSAMARLLADAPNIARIDALSRSGDVPEHPRIHPGRLDLEDDASIAEAAERIGEGPPPDAIFIASGILHGDGFGPEKDWRQLDGDTLARVFRINAIGPMLFLGQVLEQFPRDSARRIVGVISARVGSISDNRSGGWYGYRASKAALNQFLRTASIECTRRRRGTLIVGLQPGTVRTSLSDPFRSGPTEEQALEPETSARHLLAVLDGVGEDDSGTMLDWQGERVAP